MKLCLFGGSFDPVHSGHIAIAKAAYHCVQPDKILFLPAACSPFKIGQQTTFSDDARLTMLRRATRDLPWAEVSDLDLTLPPPSWSWRIVKACHNQYPQAHLFWLMGTDQWEKLHRWAKYDYLTSQLTFIVHHRGTPPAPRPGVNALFVPGEHPASASVIRQCLHRGLPLPENWLPPGVEELARLYLQAN